VEFEHNNDSIWHRFSDATTFIVYVTACDLEKSFIFKKSRNYKARVLSNSCVNIQCIIHRGLLNFPRYRSYKAFRQQNDFHDHFKSLAIVTIRYNFLPSSITTIALSCTVFEILSLVSQNLKRLSDPEHVTFGGNLSCTGTPQHHVHEI